MAKSIPSSTPSGDIAEARPTALAASPLRGRKQASLWGDAWKRLRRNRMAVVGLVIVVILCIVAIFAPLLAGESLDYQNYNALYHRPELSRAYLFGADQLGRSILSRVIWGARVSMLVGLLSQVIVVAIGVPVGAISGHFGGKTDLIIMRIVDVMYAFPQLLFVILLMSWWGRGLFNIFLAIGLTGWVTLARLVRAQFLTLRERDYVIAARAIGADDTRVIVKHMLPNAMTPIIVAVTFGIPAAIFTEAFLSFIGVGIGPPNTSWGVLLGENQQYLRTYPWMLLPPAAAISITLLSFTFLGDGLRDALDPSMKD
ncbi:MAG TPA: ABC transporter permease [Thermomicrobiales bacterium]|nr:ABC transporter permease [Thermomicrobiales bacterium]